ncbi:MAG TPA: type II toxin-antitoxin system VapC family toxin [Nitrososphaerales archaeon]|nr:type II toxin-antitoxin system VapC family toxin [Nitrososphaerales archaeon]
MSSILTIDTNIWAYFFDKDCPEHRFVVEPVEKAIRSDEIWVNTIIIMELSHFLIKNLGPIQGGEKIDTFLTYPLTIQDLNYKSVLRSIEDLKRYSHFDIGGRDATIISLMRTLPSKRIMTHDQALKRVDWLKVIDPIP